MIVTELYSFGDEGSASKALQVCVSTSLTILPALSWLTQMLIGSGALTPVGPTPGYSKFFHSLSITSIFSRLHRVLNVGKKISNYTV
jgi:hypothetical protein